MINNENPMVSSLMKARFFPNSDFLNAKIGSNPSYIERSILATKDMVKQGCRKRIGNEDGNHGT